MCMHSKKNGFGGLWVNFSDARIKAENVPHQNQTSGDFHIILDSFIAPS